MKPLFSDDFRESARKHSGIKNIIQRKVDMIIDNPVALGEPLKGNLRGYYSSPVKRKYLIIYLYCLICRKKGDDSAVRCHDCRDHGDDTIKFVAFGPHDKTYKTTVRK